MSQALPPTSMPGSPDSAGQFLYLFLDEAGNFDFSERGTKYFLIGAITKERPFHACRQLTDLKYDLVEQGVDIEYFHASEDKQATRDAVFDVIEANLEGVRYDAVVVEKAKTFNGLQPPEKFYPKMLGFLLRYILERSSLQAYSEVLVFTDRIPVNKKRSGVEKAVKQTLKQMLPEGTRYRIMHHDSKSNFDLQIADYFNWAVYRKWERGDERSVQRIQQVIRSEFDIFSRGWC